MKILVVQTGFLGDVILSSAVYPNIKRLFKGAQLTVLTTPQALDLVRGHADVDQTIAFDKRGADAGLLGLRRMAKRLKREQFSVVFSLHKSYRTALLLRLAGIPTRYGFSEAKFRFLYSRTSPRADLQHDVLRNLAILRNIDCEPADLEQRLAIGIPAEVEAKVSELLGQAADRPVIGIAPGSVWATKRWMPIGFAKVAEVLRDKGYSVVLLGGPADAAIAHCIESVTPGIINFTGKTSLIESVAIVKKCALLVTNDSAPLHIASAVGTPAVALFCATVPEFGYGPWQIPAISLGVQGLSCRPCRSHGGDYCPTGTHACQRQLAPERVIEACEQLLGRNELRANISMRSEA